MSKLLPPNSTQLERDIEGVIDARLSRIEVPIRHLWNPWTCPVWFLPWLAWAFSVESWDSNWSEQEKREVIANSFYIHQKKGTISAIRKVVEPLGYLLDVVNWFEKTPQGTPHTFALKIGVLNKGISDVMYSQMSTLIDDAKGCRDHLIGLELVGETQGSVFVSSSTITGDITTVYPYFPDAIELTCAIQHVGIAHLIDYTRVNPQ